MSLFPTIERELRSSSRQAFTWHLRVLGAGAALLAGFGFSSAHGFDLLEGGRLFAQLHLALFCAVWAFVPLLTADCLSRERREGTLGLLFLTPLSAASVVTAKGLAHGLRAVTLGLAAVPVLTIPFLLGGVSWAEAVLSVLVNLSAMALALSAGLLASCLGRSWARVVFLAGLLSVLFCGLYCLLYGGLGPSRVFLSGSFLYGRGFGSPYAGPEPGWQGFLLATDGGGCWSMLLSRLPKWAAARWVSETGGAAFLSVLALGITLRLCAWRVGAVWQEEPASARVVWIQDQFCRPRFFQGLYRRYMARRMNRNPVGWLEQRTWSARVITWIWLGIVICLYCALVTDANLLRDNTGFQIVVGASLAGVIAASAAGSFRRERENGVLELLLVSPLREREIITGRLRGLRGQFYLAAGALVLLWLDLASILPDQRRWGLGPLLFLGTAFVSLPVIGLYFSLSCRTFLAALFSTLAAGMVLPVLLPELAGRVLRTWVLGWPGSGWAVSPGGPSAVCLIAVAVFCRARLLARLKKRSFPLARWS